MPLSDYRFDLGPAVQTLEGEVGQELVLALNRFAPMHSPHEGLAVVFEEYEELRRHVHENTGRTRDARAEAIQLAAMGLRYVLDLCDTATADSAPVRVAKQEAGR